MFGHSVREIAAAYISVQFGFQDGLSLAILRARTLHQLNQNNGRSFRVNRSRPNAN